MTQNATLENGPIIAAVCQVQKQYCMTQKDHQAFSAPKPSRLALFSWCLYDWANSAFSTIVITFVFSAYFTQSVAEDPIVGTALWGRTLSLAALIVALSGPVLGAIADKTGSRKPWLGGFTVISHYGRLHAVVY